MVRSVTDPVTSEPKGEMSAIGLLLAGVSTLVMLPLLPLLAALKVIDWLRGGNRAGRVRQRVDGRVDEPAGTERAP